VNLTREARELIKDVLLRRAIAKTYREQGKEPPDARVHYPDQDVRDVLNAALDEAEAEAARYNAMMAGANHQGAA
jgi:hypothetical protein